MRRNWTHETCECGRKYGRFYSMIRGVLRCSKCSDRWTGVPQAAARACKLAAPIAKAEGPTP